MHASSNSKSKVKALDRQPSVLRATLILCGFALVGAAVSTYSHAQQAPAERKSVKNGVDVQVVPKVSDGEKTYQDQARIVRDAYRAKELKRQRDERALPALTTVESTRGSGA